jgi:GlpG protein
MLEEKYGSKRIMQVILITAFVTGVVNYILFPNVALCGASGVVFAFILLTSFTSFRNGEIPLTFILVAVVFLGQQVYEGVVLTDDISNMSHVIGGIIGAVVGFKLNRK